MPPIETEGTSLCANQVSYPQTPSFSLNSLDLDVTALEAKTRIDVYIKSLNSLDLDVSACEVKARIDVYIKARHKQLTGEWKDLTILTKQWALRRLPTTL